MEAFVPASVMRKRESEKYFGKKNRASYVIAEHLDLGIYHSLDSLRTLDLTTPNLNQQYYIVVYGWCHDCGGYGHTKVSDSREAESKETRCNKCYGTGLGAVEERELSKCLNIYAYGNKTNRNI